MSLAQVAGSTTGQTTPGRDKNQGVREKKDAATPNMRQPRVATKLVQQVDA